MLEEFVGPLLVLAMLERHCIRYGVALSSAGSLDDHDSVQALVE